MLNKRGYYTFHQLDQLNEDKKAEFMQEMNWQEYDWGKWNRQAMVLGSAMDDDDETLSVTS